MEAFTRPVRGGLEVGQVLEKMLVLSLTPAVKLRGNIVHAGGVCVPPAFAEALAATQQNADENADEGTPKYKEIEAEVLQNLQEDGAAHANEDGLQAIKMQFVNCEFNNELALINCLQANQGPTCITACTRVDQDTLIQAFSGTTRFEAFVNVNGSEWSHDSKREMSVAIPASWGLSKAAFVWGE